MASPSTPQLTLHLIPAFDDSGTATGLAARLAISGIELAEGAKLCKSAPFPVRVRDDHGPHELLHEDGVGSGAQQVARATQGTVFFEVDAPLQPEDAKVKDRAELRLDHGGIIGTGRGFLPRLALPSASYQITVKWDLSQAAAGTKAASTLGDGPEPATVTGPSDLLVDAVYAVGALNQFPEDLSAATASEGGVCHAYWFGSLPPNLDALKDFNHKMFPSLKGFFEDTEGSYRVFLRKVPNGFGGLTVGRSSLIEYNKGTVRDHDWDLVRLLNHHMVRSWVQLDPEDDGTENDWFSIGLSELYSIYFPYRFKQRLPDYFRYTMNGFLTGYFTSPLIGLPLSEVAAREKAGDVHAHFVLPMRACIYMIRMDAYSRRASRSQDAGVLRPIDEIVREICAWRRHRQPMQTRDWLRLIGRWIGEEAAKTHFQGMMDGEVVSFADMETAFDGIYPETREVLDFGFERKRVGANVVASNVVPGSRAAEAGLKDGDVITGSSRPGRVVTNFHEKHRITVDRSGESVDIEYWPRSTTTKVPAWESRPKDTQ